MRLSINMKMARMNPKSQLNKTKPYWIGCQMHTCQGKTLTGQHFISSGFKCTWKKQK